MAGQTLIPPSWPHAGQKQWFYRPERFKIIAAGTKAGKTYGAALWLLFQALKLKRDELSWWVAPVHHQSKIAFRLMHGWLSRYRCNGRKLTFSAKQSPPYEIVLPNGALIEFRSAEKPDNLFGYGVKRAVFDEASRAREDAWIAFRSTVTETNGKACLIANARGTKNFFYELWKKGQSKGKHDRQYFSCRQPTDSNPRLPVTCFECDWVGRDRQVTCPKCGGETESALESARRAIKDERKFAALYLAEFLDEGFGVFPGWSACQIGDFEPPVPGCHYVIGADFARKQTWSVFTVTRVDTHHVVHIVKSQAKWKEQIRMLAALAAKYNNATIWGDATGLGDPVLEWLSEYPVTFQPYQFGGQGLVNLVNRLTGAIGDQEYTFPTAATDLADELDQFEETISSRGTVKLSAPSGYFDDHVMSFGLAVLGCESWQDGELVVSGGGR